MKNLPPKEYAPPVQNQAAISPPRNSVDNLFGVVLLVVLEQTRVAQ